MTRESLENQLRAHREGAGLSQLALAEQVGVTRQAILAIEGGRQVPSTSLALALARALGCSVETLFSLGQAAEIAVERPDGGAPAEGSLETGARVTLARVAERWIAHAMPADASLAADGIVTRQARPRRAWVQPLESKQALGQNVLVAGCAPLLGALAQRVGARSRDARVRWLGAGSRGALQLLKEGRIHVAGVHLAPGQSPSTHVEVVREVFPDQEMVIVHLTCWQQGFVVPAGNPEQIRKASDLLRPGLRFVARERGAGAHALLERLLAADGTERPPQAGAVAAGHDEVAQRVRHGAADVGIAIEGVALAHGLGFVPLVEERFDLVVPTSLTATAPVCRLLEALDSRAFRAEAAHLPGYDTSISGHAINVGSSSQGA